MAMSGEFTTSGSGDSSRSILFRWSAKNNGNRTATVSWTIGGGGKTSGYVASGPTTAVVNGQTFTYPRTDLRHIDHPSAGYGVTTLGSGSFNLNYDSNGNASFSVSITSAVYSYTNNHSGSATFSLDKIADQIVIGLPTIYSTTAKVTRTSITFSASIDKGSNATSVSYNWYCNGQTLTGESPTFYNLTPNTTYTYDLDITNNGGKTAMVSGTTATSGNPPSLSVSISNIGRTSAKINYSASYDTNASYKSITYYYRKTTDPNATATTNSTLTNLTPNTQYYYSAILTDSFNRSAASSSTPIFTTSGNAPSVSVSISNVGRASAHVNSSVTYDTNASYSSHTVYYKKSTDTNYTSTTSYDLSLLPNTTYNYYVSVKDNFGRTGTSGVGTFTTTGNPPSVSLATNTIGRTVATIGYSFSFEHNASYSSHILYYKRSVDSNYSSVNSSWNLSNLIPNTNYDYYIYVVDNFGRTGTSSVGHFITTGYPPSVSDVSITTDKHTANFSFNMSFDTNASLKSFSIYCACYREQTDSRRIIINNSYNFTNLHSNIEYQYWIKVIDNFDRLYYKYLGTFTTKSYDSFNEFVKGNDINNLINDINVTLSRYGVSLITTKASTDNIISKNIFNNIINGLNNCIQSSSNRRNTIYTGSSINITDDILRTSIINNIKNIDKQIYQDYL